MTRDRSDRGAVLVQVAVAILVLTAMATFVVDQGIAWVSRGQAQNAADAGALSGAVALAYDELTYPPASDGKTFSSASGAALANDVWAATPTVIVENVMCPDYLPFAGSCLRVDVYRNGKEGSTPLPTIFGKLLNISSQGVRATATAMAAVANRSSNCLRPWMVPDYGFEVPRDIGTVVTLHPNSQGTIEPSNYFKVDFDGTGAANYENNISECSGFSVSIGDTLTSFPGNANGPTRMGVQDLVDSDPGATWNGTMIVGSAFTISPRIVPIALFSPAEYEAMGFPSGRFDLHVVNILGFFVQEADKKDKGEVTGVLVTTAGVLNPGGPTVGPGASFLKKILLVQ